MKNRIVKKLAEWSKQYFLSVAASPSPFLLGFIVGALSACAAGVVASAAQQAILSLWLMGGFLVFGVVLGVANEVVCHLFVSCCPGTGAFFAYEALPVEEAKERWSTRGKLLATAFGRLWFPKWKKGTEIRWFWLPPTDRQERIEMNLGPFSVSLKTTFGEFNLEEIYNKVLRWSDCQNLYEWLRSQLQKEVEVSKPVQQTLRQLNSRTPEVLLAELEKPLKQVLARVRFSGPNIQSIEATVSYTSSVTFNMA